MATRPLLDKRTPWTAEDWQDLPDDGRRYEIVEGKLVVAPPPSAMHQAVAARVHRLVLPSLPGHFDVQENIGVRLGDSIRIPDLVVLSAAAVWRPGGVLLPEDVLLAVEVVSPSNARDDRIVKPAQLAAASVPHFWLVDPAGGPAVHVHRLAGSVYEQTHLGRGEDVLDLHEPFPVTLVPSRLLPPRP